MRLTFAILAVLVAAGASAQTDDRAKLSIAGRAWGSFENVQTSGATTPGANNSNNIAPRFRTTNDASYVRVRGDYKVDDDLSAWGQVEAQFTLDGSGATPFDSNRNIGVGLTSKTYGTLMLGKWDSPYKVSTINLDPWGITGVNGYQNILGQLPAVGTVPSQGNIYDARMTNGVQYWSPMYQGVQLKVGYVPNERRTVTLNPWALSAMVSYDGGANLPLYLVASYEYRVECKDVNAASSCAGGVLGTSAAAAPKTTDTGLRLGAMYTHKPTFTRVAAIFEMLTSKADAAPPAAFTDLSRNAYYLSLSQGIGSPKHEIAAAFGLADKVSTTPSLASPADKTGAMFYTVAYRYNWTPTLMLYAAYVRIDNDDAATYDFGSASITSGGTGIAAGADPEAYNVGIRFLF